MGESRLVPIILPQFNQTELVPTLGATRFKWVLSLRELISPLVLHNLLLFAHFLDFVVPLFHTFFGVHGLGVVPESANCVSSSGLYCLYLVDIIDSTGKGYKLPNKGVDCNVVVPKVQLSTFIVVVDVEETDKLALFPGGGVPVHVGIVRVE